MRPYATEVCGRIETLKSTSWTEYEESLERGGLGAREERQNGIDAQHLREVEMELDEARALLLTAETRVGEATAHESARGEGERGRGVEE